MPLYVAFFLRFLVSSVEWQRCSRCSADVYDEDQELRVSTDTRTEVEVPVRMWDSLEIGSEECPWFFFCEERDSLPSHGDVANVGCASRCHSVLPAKERSDAQADWLSTVSD